MCNACVLRRCEERSICTEQPTLIDTMSLEEKVGQILFVRCVDDEQTDDLMSIKPGGILMFGRDFDGTYKRRSKRKNTELSR